jgi:tetratricopeptide (TPR) repeat protein
VKEKEKIPENSMNHLNDEEIALCAQEMLAQRYPGKVPESVQNHLATCASCKTAVLELYHLVAEEPTVVEAAKQAGRKEIPGQENSRTTNLGRPAITPAIKWYAVAAAAVIILALSLVFLMNRKDSPQKLFTQYYSPYHDVVTSKSQAERNFLLDGLFYYNTAQYDSAIDKFISGLEVRHDDQDLIFYLGSSYLAAGNHEKAIISFERLFEPGSKYYSPARWYLALAYLGSKDVNEAKRLLELIREEGGFYSEKAGKILEQLR